MDAGLNLGHSLNRDQGLDRLGLAHPPPKAKIQLPSRDSVYRPRLILLSSTTSAQPHTTPAPEASPATRRLAIGPALQKVQPAGQRGAAHNSCSKFSPSPPPAAQPTSRNGLARGSAAHLPRFNPPYRSSLHNLSTQPDHHFHLHVSHLWVTIAAISPTEPAREQHTKCSGETG